MNPRNAALGERIRQARKTLGLTQQQFAAQLAVTQPTVHRWEKGFYDPDEDALQRLAGMTQLSPAYFRYGAHNGDAAPRTVLLSHYVDDEGEVRKREGGAEPVELPPGEQLLAALRVKGSGLAPIYRQGDLLFHAMSKTVSADCLGRECVVKVIDGPILLRRVDRAGQRGRYTLSWPDAAKLAEVMLAWASPVLWVRRA